MPKEDQRHQATQTSASTRETNQSTNASQVDHEAAPADESVTGKRAVGTQPLDSSASSVYSADSCDEAYGCIGYVGHDVFLGSRKARIPELLQEQGITHVLAIGTQEDIDKYATLDGRAFKLKTVVASDSESFDIRLVYDQVKNFIEEGSSGGKRILIHCCMGQSRSVATIALYLIDAHAFSVLEALLLLLSVRLDIRPQNSFIDALKDMEELDKQSEESFESPNLPGSLKRRSKSAEIIKKNMKMFEGDNAKNVGILRNLLKRRGGDASGRLYEIHRFKQVYRPL